MQSSGQITITSISTLDSLQPDAFPAAQLTVLKHCTVNVTRLTSESNDEWTLILFVVLADIRDSLYTLMKCTGSAGPNIAISSTLGDSIQKIGLGLYTNQIS